MKSKSYWLIAVPLAIFYLVLAFSNKIPTYDTLGIAELSSLFYGAISHHHEVPLWSPYVDWGRDIRLSWIRELHPSVILVSPLTLIWSGWNSLHLYYLSLFIDELILLGGVYLLGGLLYTTALARVFVGLSLAGSIFWFEQAYATLHLFYFLPLVMYFVVKGVREKSPTEWLWGAWVMAIAGLYGNAGYFILMQTLYLVIFAGMTLWQTQTSPIALVRNLGRRDGLLCVLIFFTALTSFAFLVRPGMPTVFAEGRTAGGAATLESFLGVDHDSPLRLLSHTATGLRYGSNNDLYVGLICLPLVIAGFFFIPLRRQLPLLVSGLFFFLLARGKSTPLASAVYQIPGMSYYRYVVLLYPLAKYSLVLLAGVALDGWIAKRGSAEGHRLQRALLGALFVVSVLIGYLLLEDRAGIAMIHRQRVIAFLALAVFFMLAHLRGVFNPTVFLLIVAFDVFGYRALLYHGRMLRVSAETKNLFRLRPLQYQPQRTFNYFDDARWPDFAKFIHSEQVTRDSVQKCLTEGCRFNVWSRAGGIYGYLPQFLGFDPCLNLYRSDYATPGVAEIYRRYRLDQQVETRFLQKTFVPVPDSVLSTAGCTEPKLRIFLKFESGTLTDPIATPISVRHFSENEVRLETGKADEPARWLYYADAWHSGWRAFVNGKETEIKKANTAFKAIALPAGPVQVTLKYGTWTDSALMALMFAWQFVFLGILIRRLTLKKPTLLV